MQKSLVRKGLVLGIIVLFIGASIIPSIGSISIKKEYLIENETPFKNLDSRGNTLYVGGSGGGNYSTIQSAINAANPGDTVFVYNDSSPYYENVVIGKTINLVGEDKDTTIIDGDGNEDVVYVSANWINISGFTIQNSGNVYLHDAGIQICSNFGTFSSNIILKNRYGIYLYGSNGNTVIGNIISNNADGVLLWGASDTVVGNALSNNWYGIYLDDACNNTIMKNNFYSNKQHAFFENCINTWENNYWSRTRLFPKLIFGIIQIGSKWIPWLNIDWHPAQEPYDIDNMGSVPIEKNGIIHEGVDGYVK